MDTGWLVLAGTVATAIGAVIGALGKSLVDLIKARSSARIAEQKASAEQEENDRRTTIAEWKEIAELERQQNERNNIAIRQLQSAVSVLQAEHSDCREDYAEMKTVARFLYGHMARLHAHIVSLGGDPGALPAMPEFQDRPLRAENEFVIRQAEQTAKLVNEADKVVRKPKEAPPCDS